MRIHPLLRKHAEPPSVKRPEFHKLVALGNNSLIYAEMSILLLLVVALQRLKGADCCLKTLTCYTNGTLFLTIYYDNYQ